MAPPHVNVASDRAKREQPPAKKRYSREAIPGGNDAGLDDRDRWRGSAAFLACVAMGGVALAQGAAPIPPPSTTAATPAANAAAEPPAIPAAQLLTQTQLDQLVAPIALYPDPLLAQILMASTYPLEVVEAARWVSVPANRALTGDALTHALQAQNWDPSVKALVPFPRVLENMSNQLQWTEELGNAFLAQQADVMAAVQRLRHEAMAAGNLKQTPQCRCVIQTSGETISILPAEPQVVCAPVYSPAVYGAWSYPAYPPYSFPVPAGFAYPPGFWIGYEPPIELASFSPLWGWGSVDWGHPDIAVNPGHYALASGGHPAFSGSLWVHNPAHRGGVAYAGAATRARFDAARVAALTASARSGAAREATAAARFGAARGEATRGGAGRFGAMAAIHGGAAASDGKRRSVGRRPSMAGRRSAAQRGSVAHPQPRAERRSALARPRFTAARHLTAAVRMAAARHISRWVARMAAARRTVAARMAAGPAATAAEIAAAPTRLQPWHIDWTACRSVGHSSVHGGVGRSDGHNPLGRASTIGRPFDAPEWVAMLERRLRRPLAPRKPPKPRADTAAGQARDGLPGIK